MSVIEAVFAELRLVISYLIHLVIFIRVGMLWGKKEQRVGRYMPDFVLENGAADRWFNSRVSEQKCVNCKYVFFCGGGCLANAYRVTGKVKSGECNDYPRLFGYGIRQLYNKKIKKGIDES